MELETMLVVLNGKERMTNDLTMTITFGNITVEYKLEEECWTICDQMMLFEEELQDLLKAINFIKQIKEQNNV